MVSGNNGFRRIDWQFVLETILTGGLMFDLPEIEQTIFSTPESGENLSQQEVDVIFEKTRDEAVSRRSIESAYPAEFKAFLDRISPRK